MPEKVLTYREALQKAGKYCALQERCVCQLSGKFDDWGVDSSFREPLLQELISLGYLNEERFARAFVRGKLRINGWGKIKIVAALRQLNVDEVMISRGLEEIDNDDYLQKLSDLLCKKRRTMPEHWEEVHVRQKLSAYALSKGYRTEEIVSVLNQLMRKRNNHDCT